MRLIDWVDEEKLKRSARSTGADLVEAMA
jgi:hypothetical protein